MLLSSHALTQPSEKRVLSVLEVVLLLLLVYYALEPVIAIVRLYRIDQASFLYKLVSVSLLGAGMAVIAYRGRIKTDYFWLFIASMGVIGLLVGMLNSNPINFYVAHTFNMVFPLVLYAAYKTEFIDRKHLKSILNFGLWLIFYISLSSMIYFIVFMQGNGFYYGMSVAALMIPLAYFLQQKRWLMVLTCIILMVLSGKRGVMLAGLAEVAVWVLSYRFKHLFSMLFICSTVGTAAIVAMMFVSADLSHLHPMISKWNMINPFSPDYRFEVGTGGRWTEIIRAYEAFDVSWSNWLFGAGHGFHYDWWSETGHWNYDFDRHYTHSSPFNYLFRYGAVLTFGFFGCLMLLLSKIYRYMVTHRDDWVSTVFVLYIFGRLAHGVTNYTWATDPLLWIALGYMAYIVYVRDQRI